MGLLSPRPAGWSMGGHEIGRSHDVRRVRRCPAGHCARSRYRLDRSIRDHGTAEGFALPRSPGWPDRPQRLLRATARVSSDPADRDGTGGGLWRRTRRLVRAVTAHTDRDLFSATKDVWSGAVGFRCELARLFKMHAGMDVGFSAGETASYFQIGNAWFRP
jgi:hypothetical protein